MGPATPRRDRSGVDLDDVIDRTAPLENIDQTVGLRRKFNIVRGDAISAK